MYLEPNWKILTVGDGDLSFSRSLLEDRGHKNLVVSSLDSAETIKAKYDSNDIEALHKSNITIFHELDIADVETISKELFKKFDLVIFQFPLIPIFKSRQDYLHALNSSSNLLNRQLIVNFINHCAEHLLASGGANLCYITSKDVKPYCDWDLENIGPLVKGVTFMGLMDFDYASFPKYRIRNVDRDKQIKATEATTYVWGRKDITELNAHLHTSAKHWVDHCRLCGKGPFANEEIRAKHENSKTHQRRLNYHTEWLKYLANKNHSN